VTFLQARMNVENTDLSDTVNYVCYSVLSHLDTFSLYFMSRSVMKSAYCTVYFKNNYNMHKDVSLSLLPVIKLKLLLKMLIFFLNS